MNIIDRKPEIKDGKLTITTTTEETLNRTQVEERILYIHRQQQVLKEKSMALKHQYTTLDEQKAELEELLNHLPKEGIDTL